MPRTRILLVAPGPGTAADALAALGIPPAREGERTEAAFASYAAGADALCEILSRGLVPHAVLFEARFDPSMCLPQPACLRVDCPGLTGEARHMRLPHRFPDPGFDLRTFLAAGMAEADARACLAALGPAAVALAA